MSDKGFIKIDRKIIDWKYYNKPDMLALWIHILINAYWQDGLSHGEQVKRGQFWTTYKELGQELGFGIAKIKRALMRLEIDKQIELKSTNKKTLISVVNYDIYQGLENESEKQTISKSKNKRKTKVQKAKNPLIQKKLLEEVKEIYIYGEFANVQLSADEYQKLVNKYSEDVAKRAIEYLSSYKIEKGYKTKSDYLTILRWVIKAVTEKESTAKVAVPGFMKNPIKESKPASGETLQKIKEIQESMK